jgi:hypothetical protein
VITLAATNTIAGVASVGAKLTSTIYGDEVSAAGDTFKVLDQRQLAAIAATIYTVPAATIALVKSIHVVNTDVSDRTVQYFVNGTASSNAITPVLTIPAGGFGTYSSAGWRVATSTGALVGGMSDGGDVAEGATTDAAVITDTTGTVSGKLRGLVKWAFERMPASLGQKVMASSFPVTIASDQATFPVTASAGANLNTSALALEAGHLATIDTSTAKIPSQGQAIAANSMPVVLPAAQITTLTPPAAITGFALDATLTTTNTTLSTIDTDIKSNVSLATSPNVIGHVVVDSAPTTAVTNTGLTDLDASIGTDGSFSIPASAVQVGGFTNDLTPTFQQLPLGSRGRSVLVENVIPDETAALMLRELRLLRQDFEDWARVGPPRIDESTIAVVPPAN